MLLTRNLPDFADSYIQYKGVSVAVDHAPIKVAGSHNSNSSVDERVIDRSNLSYY